MTWFLAEHYPVLVIVISMFAAFTILIAGMLNKKAAFPISLATIFIQLLMALSMLKRVLAEGPIHYQLGGWAPPWGIEYVIDTFNAYVLIVILLLSFVCAIYSKRSVEKELPLKIVPFYSVFQLLITGLCGIVVTGDIFNLYVFLEISALASYALIAVAGGRALKASYNYVIMGSMGACFYLLGAGFLYAVTGTLNMADLSALLPPLYGNRAVQAAFVFFAVGMSIKMALFPLHVWQPDAYTYAPSAVSAIIAATMSKVSVYALIRVIFSVFTIEFLQSYGGVEMALCWIAAIGIIAGSVLAIQQTKLKRMLAYSSIAQIGYIVLGIGLAPISAWGLVGAIAHILNHAIMKGCLFLAAGAFIYKLNLWDIKDFEGLGKKMPFASAAFTLAAIAMIGVPPCTGFATKLYLLFASLDATATMPISGYAFVVILMISTLLNLAYFWRIVDRIYFVNSGHGHHNDTKKADVPISMVVPMLLLAVLCIVVGILWLTGVFAPMMDQMLCELGVGGMPQW
ncbi:MAG: monovalent cation/H+ antiporter subunit D family protein [Euryarchaeota archaeon]|nr:monovalent cation/H+ antiporter subunit D family protein [Euryarchaeota archaeon]